MLFNAFAAVVIGGVSLKGGIGNLSGVYAGVLLLASIQTAINLMGLPAHYTQMILGALVLAAVLIDTVKLQIRQTLACQEASCSRDRSVAVPAADLSNWNFGRRSLSHRDECGAVPAAALASDRPRDDADPIRIPYVLLESRRNRHSLGFIAGP